MSDSRWKHRARVLVLPTREKALREVARIGAQDPGTQWLTDKASFRAIRVENVDGRAASLLKQEMLSLGGDCTVHRQVASFDQTPRPVILLGTLRQYRRLVRKTIRQPFGLREVGESVRRALKAFEPTPFLPLRTPHGSLVVGNRTLVMGIINMTEASFSGDGLDGSVEAAVQQAQRFAQAGADIIDVGGESTRPGTPEIDEKLERERVLPALEAIREAVDLPISVDTRRASVARAAVSAGADMVNDVWGLREEGMLEAVAELEVPAVIMHMQGTPQTMQDSPHYDDLITEIYDFFATRLEAAVEAGIPEQQIILDPGFGFGKTVNHNLEIVRRLREFRSLGRPLLLGPSRKSTIGKVLDKPVEERLWGTAATCAVAIANGADLIRVHDVEQMVQVARMTDAVLRGYDAAD